MEPKKTATSDEEELLLDVNVADPGYHQSRGLHSSCFSRMSFVSSSDRYICCPSCRFQVGSMAARIMTDDLRSFS